MAVPPPDEPLPPNEPLPPRRPIYYPAGPGCFFWILIIILIWIIVGLFARPLWWPWWW